MPRLSRNERIVSARCLRGYSQGELADAIHVSRITMNRIETMKTIPSVSLALAIANAVNATVEELFSHAELR